MNNFFKVSLLSLVVFQINAHEILDRPMETSEQLDQLYGDICDMFKDLPYQDSILPGGLANKIFQILCITRGRVDKGAIEKVLTILRQQQEKNLSKIGQPDPILAHLSEGFSKKLD